MTWHGTPRISEREDVKREEKRVADDVEDEEEEMVVGDRGVGWVVF